MRPDILIAYCTGLIVVCTILMTYVAVSMMRSQALLRRIADDTVGMHDDERVRNARAAPERPNQREAPPARRTISSGKPTANTPVQRFDSADSTATPPPGGAEWTGPVTTYIPADRLEKPPASSAEI